MTEHAELAALAQQQGLTGAWLSEVNGYDAITQAAAVGAAMPGARIGTAIVPMQTRDPLLMAMSAASLASVLEGPFILGLGTSTRVIVEDWHSQPWDKPLSLTREYVSLLRSFFAGERVTIEGRYSYNNSRLGFTAADIPIYLAALNDRMLELAGEIADGVILNFASPQYFEHARERIDAGRQRRANPADSVEILVFWRVSVVEDFAFVRDRYQREMVSYFMAPPYQRMWEREGLSDVSAEVEALWKSGDRGGALAAIPDDAMQQRVLAGTAEEVEAQLRPYFARGLNTAILMPVPTPGRDYRAECDNPSSTPLATSRPMSTLGVRNPCSTPPRQQLARFPIPDGVPTPAPGRGSASWDCRSVRFCKRGRMAA
ncbi:MAG: LLM class F420-dependent oxidoreductase [Dehalococcoidia bacterium]|nr:LLM class F420-dependent oxidoreductase [Dehalococcoidia bacterium]